jgi:hypothetical protein
MNLFSAIVALLSLTLVAFANIVPPHHVILERREATKDWKKTQRPKPNSLIQARIALSETGIEDGPKYLLDM